MNRPDLDAVRTARARIARALHRTPILTCRSLDEKAGATLFFKCENFQKAGAFKFRGACNAVFALSEEEAGRGVVTHSSGNHGAALALAGRIRGTRVHVVMPENAPEVKKAAVAGYGAQITFCRPTLEAREEATHAIIARTGATLVHPYDDPRIIAGQGTCALEFLEEVPDLDAVLAPVGGGGLLSGTAIVAKSLRPSAAVVGCEPKNAGDAWESLQAGRIVPVGAAATIADGLRTSLGEWTFPILRELVDRIALVTEEEIVEATRLLFERMKIVVEPSAAVGLAAVLSGAAQAAGRVGVILSGGNVDLERLPFGRSPRVPSGT